MCIFLHILKNTQIDTYKYVFKNTQVSNGERNCRAPQTVLRLFVTAAFCTQTPADLKNPKTRPV